MSLHVDVKYVLLLSSRLERYTRKSEYLWNCRCPICGDSSASKFKARGYIFRNKKDPTCLSYRCFNCQYSSKFSYFLKKLDGSLYKEYRLERFRKTTHVQKQVVPKIALGPIIQDKQFENAVSCDTLEEDHICSRYLSYRKIPKQFWSKLYFTPNYKKFIYELLPDTEKSISEDARLVIPYFNTKNEILAVTGRSFEKRGIRYITMRVQNTTDKLIYGLDRLDNSKKCYIVEGPLDSLFLPNTIASGDSNLVIVAKSISAAQVVLVFDNERRNKEINLQLEQAIKDGYPVVIWPETIKEKDINEMVQSGRTVAEIQEIIDRNTVSGLSALVKFKFWRRN